MKIGLLVLLLAIGKEEAESNEDVLLFVRRTERMTRQTEASGEISNESGVVRVGKWDNERTDGIGTVAVVGTVDGSVEGC